MLQQLSLLETLEIKKVQRQFRKEHPDLHYAVCIFWYQREYAATMRDHSMFLCLDDKHKIKVDSQ